MDWLQTIATIASVFAVGLSLVAYITRQFNRMGDKLENLDNRLQNVEKQQVSFNQRFDRIDDRFEHIGDKLENLDNRLQNVEKQQVSFNQRFDRIDDRFDHIDDRFGRIDDRFSQVDRRLDRMDSRFGRQEERLEEGLQDVRGDLQILGIEQARMLGFLEGRGVMAKTTAEAERAS